MDLYKMSKTRKIALTALAVIFSLSILGTAHAKGFTELAGITVFFLAIAYIILLWIK